LLDPTRSPEKDGICIIKKVYSALAMHLRLTGDTGNGFRGYLMLDFLSKVQKLFGFLVELIPLCPRHAYNETDARIARLNTFFNKLLAKTVVCGAEECAAALRAAADPRFTTKRKFIKRTHAFFRVVPQVPDSTEHEAYLESNHLARGKTGVMGLLYFNFSFETPDGTIYPEGYCRARKHADQSKADNPTFVYTWRKSLANEMCQKCSDRVGAPVARSISGCTKRACKWGRQSRKRNRNNVRPLPLSLSNRDEQIESTDNEDKSTDDDDGSSGGEDEESDSLRREDVEELEHIIDHKVVSNKNGSDPQDQYQVSWVGIEVGTDWTSAERIMTWVRPDRQQNNREMLETYKATSEGTRRYNKKMATLAAKKNPKRSRSKASKKNSSADNSRADAAAGAAAGAENKRRSTRLAASANPDT
jgi:hypothetical protein